MMGWQCLLKRCQTHGIRTKYGALLSSTARPSQSGYLSNEMFPQYCSGHIQSPRATSLCQTRLGSGMIEFEKHAFFIGYRPRIESSYGFKGNPLLPPRTIRTISDLFGNNSGREPQLNRDYFVQLWVSEKRMNQYHEKRKRKIGKQKESSSIANADKSPFQNLAERLFSNDSSVSGSSDPSMQIPHQPPPSQSIMLELASPEEALVASLLARSNLLITRDIEWANLVLGFEQENRYVIVDVCYPQSPVGYIREQSNVFIRQLLRLRRPFKADITDAMGNEVYRVRRPFWWITSSIYAEIDGKEVGVVHQRWHLWKRVYDLYIGKEQFAVVENPGFWNWTFTLKGKDSEVLAEIDRDWRGFGFELFTDAGQYVIRFGSSDPSSKTGRATQIQELEVARPLSLSERAVALALAISLDNDYFSRHGGWGIPFVVVGE